ncbi:hypothetical protein J4526_00050 [Desulfurococcaceae archaeon MEX13E-LK6-19]|nr:hypothetical protein J4526_00050 [Desulfurococcaceae archaeon MEX13E-LK6-19]
MDYEEREPTWLVLKKAALELVKRGKTSFTRKELIEYARNHIDPTRSLTSLDFEIDLVTVNGNSKDRYKDPEKLFLFRIGRGRYTLYDPEIHGPIEKYLEQKTMTAGRKRIIRGVAEGLKSRGYNVEEVKKPGKPLSPDLIAYSDEEKIGVWVVEPVGDTRTQLKTFASSIGSALIERPKYNWVMVVAPPDILAIMPSDVREILEEKGIRLVVLAEERRYTIKL